MIKNYIQMTRQYLKLKVINKKLMILLALTYLFSTFTALLLPYLAAGIVEQITNQNYIQSLCYVCYLGIGFLLDYIILRLCYVIYQKNYIYVYNKMQEKVLDKVSVFDEQFTSKLSKAYIINTTADDIWYTGGLYDGIFDFLCNFIYLIIAIVILFQVNILLAIIVVIITFLYFLLDAKATKKRDYYLEKQRGCQDKITGLMNEVVDGNKEVRTFEMQDKLNKHFDVMKKNWKKAYIQKRKPYDFKEALLPLLIHFGEIAIYIILVLLLLQKNITLAAIVLIIGYYKDIYDCNANMNKYYTDLCVNDVRVKRLIKIFNYTPNHNIVFGENDTDDIFGAIEFQKVSFTYEKCKILDDISFQISPNTLTSIVGKSGSGKSTIFKLLLRMYKPDSGSVYIDGVDIYDYTKDVYSSNVSIATQKPFLFTMSIEENFNLVETNKDKQIEMCKLVGIHDFIMSLPKGYKTILEENAHNISGGQKQLLALARTLLSKAEILLFDEITASLDPNNTKHVMNILQKMKKNHTIIMITHKPSLMKKGDQIIVIDHGRVVGNGKHKKLLSNKYYQKLQK